MLEETPQDLDMLLRDAWTRIFSSIESTGRSSESIKELLRALILTFEDPTAVELSFLAGFSNDSEQMEELEALINMCEPFIVSDGGTIGFMNPVVKAHLQQKSNEILGLSAEGIKWQHGMLALRSLEHLKQMLDGPESEAGSNSGENLVTNDGADPGLSYGDDHDNGRYDNDDDDDDDDDDPDDESSSAATSEYSRPGMLDLGSVGSEDWEDEDEDNQVSDYAVKFWLRHGSEATADFATGLAQETELWARDSPMRRRWLEKYENLLTSDFLSIDHSTLKALHVAASIGFKLLVVSLIENGHGDEIQEYDVIGNTPVSKSLPCQNSQIHELRALT